MPSRTIKEFLIDPPGDPEPDESKSVRDANDDLAGLRQELDRLDQQLAKDETWRALAQLDEREARGEPLEAVTGERLRASLLAGLASNRIYHAREKVAEALAILEGRQKLPRPDDHQSARNDALSASDDTSANNHEITTGTDSGTSSAAAQGSGDTAEGKQVDESAARTAPLLSEKAFPDAFSTAIEIKPILPTEFTLAPPVITFQSPDQSPDEDPADKDAEDDVEIIKSARKQTGPIQDQTGNRSDLASDNDCHDNEHDNPPNQDRQSSVLCQSAMNGFDPADDHFEHITSWRYAGSSSHNLPHSHATSIVEEKNSLAEESRERPTLDATLPTRFEGATLSAVSETDLAMAGGVDALTPTIRLTPDNENEEQSASPDPQNNDTDYSPAPVSVDDNNLELIRGIDPELAERLRREGQITLGAISNWSFEDVVAVSRKFDLGLRIARDGWIEQAAFLTGNGLTDHARRTMAGEFRALVEPPPEPARFPGPEILPAREHISSQAPVSSHDANETSFREHADADVAPEGNSTSEELETGASGIAGADKEADAQERPVSPVIAPSDQASAQSDYTGDFLTDHLAVKPGASPDQDISEPVPVESIAADAALAKETGSITTSHEPEQKVASGPVGVVDVANLEEPGEKNPAEKITSQRSDSFPTARLDEEAEVVIVARETQESDRPADESQTVSRPEQPALGRAPEPGGEHRSGIESHAAYRMETDEASVVIVHRDKGSKPPDIAFYQSDEQSEREGTIRKFLKALTGD